MCPVDLQVCTHLVRIETSLKEEKLVDIRREVSETLVPGKKYGNAK
jgi:hypothetical protein